MATLVVTNASGEDIAISDLGNKTLADGDAFTKTIDPSDFPKMESLQAAIDAGSVTWTLTLTDAEKLTVVPDDVIAPGDLLPVAAATTIGNLVVLYAAFTAAAAGTADDVTLVAAAGLPGKIRIVDAWAVITTAIDTTTLTLRDAAAGAGTAHALMTSGASGALVRNTLNTTGAAQVAAASGVFMRRSDRGLAGRVFVLARLET